MCIQEVASHVPELAALARAGEDKLSLAPPLARDIGRHNRRQIGLVALRPVASFAQRDEFCEEILVVARQDDSAMVKMSTLPNERACKQFERGSGQLSAFADGSRERPCPSGEVSLGWSRDRDGNEPRRIRCNPMRPNGVWSAGTGGRRVAGEHGTGISAAEPE